MLRQIPLASLLFLVLSLNALCAEPPSPRAVDLKAQDGTPLKATYFAAAKPGPAVLLFHQCNRDRSMWKDVAPKLAASGLNVLTLDFRGFGESGGPRVADMTPQQAGDAFAKFSSDVDVAFQYLISQSGVIHSIGVGGASCGVNQSIHLARRHKEVKTLVLLSGFTDRDGRQFLKNSPHLPIFASAADDDQGAVDQMQWLMSLAGNMGNVFQHYPNGGHGIEMFTPHPELTGLIVNWFDTALLKTPGSAPANPSSSLHQDGSVSELLDGPGGAVKVSDLLTKARQTDPKAQLFPEFVGNILGYEYLQAGDTKGAIEIFKLNVTANPDSPNTYDSLADAYVASGDKDLARENAQKAIDLLEKDTADPVARKQAIRDSAQQKLK